VRKNLSKVWPRRHKPRIAGFTAAMLASPGTTANSPGNPPFENSLSTPHILQDFIPPRKAPRSSVDEPEQSTARKNKRQSDTSVLNRPKSYSLSSWIIVGSNTQDTHHHEHGDVRTLPRRPITQNF
jgi:hypothetical protein